jgi:hypothetical protein
VFYQDRLRTNIYGKKHSTPHTKKTICGVFLAQDDEESMDEEGLEAGAAAEKRLSLIFELEMHTF